VNPTDARHIGITRRCECGLGWESAIDLLFHEFEDIMSQLHRFRTGSGLFLLSALIASSPPLFAQNRKAPVHFEHLTIDQGLSHTNVNCILQDSRGFMWFGTEDGLDRYDGYHFTIYRHREGDSTSLSWNCIYVLHEDRLGDIWLLTERKELNRYNRVSETLTCYSHDSTDTGSLSDNKVTALFEDKTGTLWFGTANGGLNRYDEATGKFIHYMNTPSDAKSLSTNAVLSICEDKHGTLWIGTPMGLNRFDRASQNFTRYLHDSKYPNSIADNFVWLVFEDRSGTIWLGTGREGLEQFDPTINAFRHYRIEAPKHMHRGNDHFIRALHEDSHGNFWIGTVAGICKLDKVSGGVTSFTIGNDNGMSLRNFVGRVFEDTKGRMWFGMWEGGLIEYDPEQKTFRQYVNNPDDMNSLSDNSIYSLYEDRTGTLWIGTWRGGVDRIDPARKPFIHYSREQRNSNSLSSNTVYCILEDRNGPIWIGTAGGLNKLDPATSKFQHYLHKVNDANSLSDNFICSMCEDDRGFLWIGTFGGGLDMFDPTTGRFSHYRNDPANERSLSNDAVMSIVQDTGGTLWIGTDEGVNRLDRAHGTFTRYQHDPANSASLRSNNVWSMCEDKAGILWVGTVGSIFYGTGLNKFDRASGSFSYFQNDPKNPASLSNNDVYAICTDQSGTVWAGTAAGLNRYDAQKQSFTRFTVEDGLMSDYITGILEEDGHLRADQAGNLWVCTPHGLSKFNPRTTTFRNYDASDGLQVIQFKGGPCKTRGGEMYFGGINGVIRFHPDSIRDNPYVPPIVLTAFRKLDTPTRLDSAVTEKKTLHLRYSDNVFAFEFASLNYTSPEKNQYAYKLEGFDADWVYCGTRRYVTYTNLDEGSYVFRVKGSNNDGVWNEEGASIAVIITPPFWDTWWFTTFLWFAAIGTIAGTVRYVEIRKMRQRMVVLEQQQALERERLRISSDLHDELASNLSSIAMFSKIVQDGDAAEGGDGIQKKQLLARITTLSRDSIDSIRDIIWAIDPGTETLDGLFARLQDMMVVACRLQNIHAHFDVAMIGRSRLTRLAPEFRTHLWLLLKEAVNNALKHSGCTDLSLRASSGDGMLKVIVRDNGAGFDALQVSKGKGLGTMSMRAKKMSGKVVLASIPGEGTVIEIEVRM
jgi:ligand-binding sensor domain-containing protein/signal transduction histidine kinase